MAPVASSTVHQEIYEEKHFWSQRENYPRSRDFASD